MLPCKHCHVYCMLNCVITFCQLYKYTTHLGVSGSLLQWPTHEYQKKFQLLTTLLLLFLAQWLSQCASYFSNETNQKSFFNVHCHFRFVIAFLRYLVLVLTQPPQKLYPEHCVFISLFQSCLFTMLQKRLHAYILLLPSRNLPSSVWHTHLSVLTTSTIWTFAKTWRNPWFFFCMVLTPTSFKIFRVIIMENPNQWYNLL